MRIDPAMVLILSIAMDRIFGEPPDRFHPTVAMGGFISFLDKYISKGALVFLALSIPFSVLTFLLISFLSGPIKIIVAAVLLKTAFSWRGLRDYNRPIAEAVLKKDIHSARKMIPFIAGRNPDYLDSEEILSASVESVSESSVDSVLSPLYYFFLFSFISLEAGVAASIFYRAVNTLDSMLGIPDYPKGLVPAKIDEFLNFLPARIAAVLLIFSSAMLRMNVKRGITIYRRDKNKTISRNAGQTISAMAGILGVRLRKKEAYILGDPVEALAPRHIYDALRIVNVQLMLFITLMVIAWI